jgi:hypothetical protein
VKARAFAAIVLAATAAGCGSVDVPVMIENRDTKPQVVSISSFESRMAPQDSFSLKPPPEPVASRRDVGPLAPGEVREIAMPTERDGRLEIS